MFVKSTAFVLYKLLLFIGTNKEKLATRVFDLIHCYFSGSVTFLQKSSHCHSDPQPEVNMTAEVGSNISIFKMTFEQPPLIHNPKPLLEREIQEKAFLSHTGSY